jgi:uncharacterized membrane protein/predicted DsbA family dithiol-disulfide isomerase
MTSSRTPSRWLGVGIAAAGFLLCIALEVVHYRAYTAPSSSSFCSVGEALDCASVALSRYAVVLGIPMALWGAAGFLALLTAAWLRSRWLLPLALAATLASLVLLGIELFAIKSVCLLCEGVHVASVAMLVVAWRQRALVTDSYVQRDRLLLIFAPALGAIVALLIFQKPYWGAFGWKGDLPFAQGKTEEGHPWIGAEAPALVVHEFTDYSCPHCKAASAQMLREVAAHPGKLRVVRRQYARMPCPPGVAASCQLARVAYCAQEQGRFWQADRWLFEHATGRHEVDVAVAARDIGLDESRLRGCVGRADTYERAQADAKEARKKRILGTPSYIAENKVLSGQQLVKRLSEL